MSSEHRSTPMSAPSKWSLPDLAIQRPIAVSMLVFTCMVLGVVSWNRLPMEFMVQFWQPATHVVILYPGAQPSQVEREVTIPAEGMFRTIPGLRRMRSSSGSSSVSISLFFDDGADMGQARAEIRDRIERLRASLPQGVTDIRINRWGLEDQPIMHFALFRADRKDELAEYARRVLPAKLQRVPGVANVGVSGTWKSQITVEFERDTLESLKLSPEQIAQALSANNIDLGLGQITGGGRRYFVRLENEVDSFDELGNMVVAPNGLRLKDVATLALHEPTGADTFEFDGKSGVFVSVTKDSEANTVDACDGVREALATLSEDPEFAGADFHIFHDQSKHIRLALNSLFQAGQYGVVMAFLILWVFLRKLAPTLVVSLVIPASLLIAPAYIYFSGATLNLITIAAMLISVGILVDNAIVVVENIHRYREAGLPRREAARRGAAEVGLAITAATLTTLVVFIPVMYMDSGELATLLGQFAGPVVSSLLASLVLALTVIPAMESRMRGTAPHDQPRRRRAPAWLRRIAAIDPVAPAKRGYAAFLRFSLRNPLAFITAVLAALVATAVVPLPATGFRGFPDIDFRTIWVNFDTDPNYGEEQAKEEFQKIVVGYLDAHRDELGIRNLLVRQWGRSGSVQVFLKETEDLKPGEDYPMTTEAARQAIYDALPERLAGARISCGIPSSNPSPTREIEISMKGEASERLFAMADDLVTMLERLPEVTGARPSRNEREEEIQLTVDNAAAYAWGVQPTAIASSVARGLSDTSMFYIKDKGREINVSGRFAGEDRRDRGDLETITTRNAESEVVPVINLVSLERGLAPGYIEHENGKTVSGVEAQTDEADLLAVRNAIEYLVGQLEVPRGYEIGLDQNLRRIDDTLESFWTTIAMSLVLIYLLLAALFESWLMPLSVLTTVPLAFIGVYWSLYATGTPLDTIALVGSILLCGIIVNNGIVIVDQINQLRAEGLGRAEAIITGGGNRLRPVLMTTLTTVLGVLPLALGGDNGTAASAVAALGRALVGGLCAGTLLTLFVVPMAYLIFDDARCWFRDFLGQTRSLWRD
ncbi:MAG: MMPL family transporter [Candidatus Hydrogenedens sp.]|nr:MMPL family transporter [Candidatus Hydrogenedens sp.]